MEYKRLFRDSFSIVIGNIIPYGLAALILTFASMLIITAPPLLYGFISMLIKGARQEKVRTTDVFDGFRSGNFLRSWIYFIFMIAVVILLMIAWMVLYIFAGILMIIFGSLAGPVFSETMVISILIIVSLVLACIVAIPAILIVYVLPLFVIKEYSITNAISESIKMVKGHLIASTIICTVIALIALAGSLPYYIGLFFHWPQWFSLLLYFGGIILTTPLSQQILVNTTFELMGTEL
ncbi:DUF2189 domain-containing protein [Methanolobus profundi]|uniref:Membrane domain of glycerophosphoryl diester phosphodiesterase n=1 Tax=Methanolobus profundi TaxID=487685 RepID=A0A1I4PPE5_9EURY|nr:hypothetical protein [Methanolobus profundi]SFM29692.1 hypothetical protein SAMN04488696_0810 [Methanolobus profundi]